MIYLDSAAGAPLHPIVEEALLSFIKENKYYANPSSVHQLGQQSKKRVEESKSRILKSLYANPSIYDVLFTSSGTESNRWIVQSFLKENNSKQWITNNIEHPSLVDLIHEETQKAKVSAMGELNYNECNFNYPKLLVSQLYVNNETGRINNLHKFKELKDQHPQCALHLDAVASYGHVPLSLEDGALDFVVVSGYKRGALSGISAIVYKKTSVNLQKTLSSETVNHLGIYSFGKLAENLTQLLMESQEMNRLRDQMIQKLSPLGVKFFNTFEQSPHLLHFTLPRLRLKSILTYIDSKGFQISQGAACRSGLGRASHVLLALGYSEEEALRSIRVSFSHQTTLENIQQFCEIIEKMIKENSL